MEKERRNAHRKNQKKGRLQMQGGRVGRKTIGKITAPNLEQ
jgi:hypothetical protein